MSEATEGQPLEVVYHNVDELIPYVNNSRTHTDDQIMQIVSSIKEFGFTNPILIDETQGIIAGHCRLLAAKKMDVKTVPTIALNNLTEAQRKAYVIADNQLALNSGWDIEKLKIEIQGLDELDFDLDILGFNEEAILDLLNNVEEVDLPILADGDKEPFQQITFTLQR